MPQSYANLVCPDPNNCPASVAEAIWDIRNHKADQGTHKYLTERYATIDYFILAAEYVYDANDWPFNAAEKRLLRSTYRAPKPPQK